MCRPSQLCYCQGIIQIAGVIDQAEAELLVAAGVDCLGFPFRLPVNQEDLAEDEAAAIIARLPSWCRGVLITYLSAAADIIELTSYLGVRMVQLHGEVNVAQLRALRERAPALQVIKSLVVRDDNEDQLTHRVAELAPWVDMFITDTFDPATGASGATGRTHDWGVSRRLARLSPRPLMLAGGLGPHNAAQAISFVQPAAVDVHTGVEGPDGRKDPRLVADFVRSARSALFATGHAATMGEIAAA